MLFLAPLVAQIGGTVIAKPDNLRGEDFFGLF